LSEKPDFPVAGLCWPLTWLIGERGLMSGRAQKKPGSRQPFWLSMVGDGFPDNNPGVGLGRAQVRPKPKLRARVRAFTSNELNHVPDLFSIFFQARKSLTAKFKARARCIQA
jgi:hypothetical protein